MKIIVHRGITSNKIEENSYLAIKHALKEKNIEGVEFDIRITKDNIIVLSHNSVLGTNYIENMNYKDIIKEKYLSTLDKILTINTDKILLIDIKTSNNNYKTLADILMKRLNKASQKIYLASFNKKIIKYMKKKLKFKMGLISFYYRKGNFDFYVINYRTITDKKINKLKKEVFLWTVNKKNWQSVENKFSNLNKYYLIIDIKKDN